jgi:hypothetical protein
MDLQKEVEVVHEPVGMVQQADGMVHGPDTARQQAEQKVLVQGRATT